jgi:hypothetical protein
MKKTILSIACISMLALGAKAQGLYVGASVGQGFRAGGTVLGSNDDPDGSSKVVKGSYGAGFVSNVNVGYFFSKSLGAELGLGFQLGTKFKTEDNYGNNTGSSKEGANSFFINPSLIIKSSSEAKLVPYAKFGMFLGLANSSVQKSTWTNVNGAGTKITSGEYERKVKGHLATGITSALGLDYKLSDKLAIFGELNGRLASWAPRSYSITTTTTNYASGVAQPPTTVSMSGDYKNDIPPFYIGSNVPAVVLPFSSIGINVGVKFYL